MSGEWARDWGAPTLGEGTQPSGGHPRPGGPQPHTPPPPAPGPWPPSAGRSHPPPRPGLGAQLLALRSRRLPGGRLLSLTWAPTAPPPPSTAERARPPGAERATPAPGGGGGRRAPRNPDFPFMPRGGRQDPKASGCCRRQVPAGNSPGERPRPCKPIELWWVAGAGSAVSSWSPWEGGKAATVGPRSSQFPRPRDPRGRAQKPAPPPVRLLHFASVESTTLLLIVEVWTGVGGWGEHCSMTGDGVRPRNVAAASQTG